MALYKKLGVTVVNLDMTSISNKVTAIFRLMNLIKSVTPDAIQTWMYHADFLGGIAAEWQALKISLGVYITPQLPKQTTHSLDL